MHLANDGNYRETRWFTGWKRPQTVVEHYLPVCRWEKRGGVAVHARCVRARRVSERRPIVQMEGVAGWVIARVPDTKQGARAVVLSHVQSVIQEVTGQKKVPFGDAVIALNDTVMGTESCEELFVPNSPHVHMGLDGVEIFANGSGQSCSPCHAPCLCL